MQRLKKAGCPCLALTVILAMCVMLAGATASNTFEWTRSVAGGFGDDDRADCDCMAEYMGDLYAGVFVAYAGCEVWVNDGDSWTYSVGPEGIVGPGFGDVNNEFCLAMAEYGGRIYASTGNKHGCEVWVYDGKAWTCSVGPGGVIGSGFGAGEDNEGCYCLAECGGRLYAGTSNIEDGCEVWAYDGNAWTCSVGPGGAIGSGFGAGEDNDVCRCMADYDGRLHAGTSNPFDGCEVWAYDGDSWTCAAGPGGAAGSGFGDMNNRTCVSLEQYMGELYAGTGNDAGGYSEGCQIWAYDGNSWTRTVTGGFGDEENETCASMAEYAGRLYAGTWNFSTGCEVWNYDGRSWVCSVGPDGELGPGFGAGSKNWNCDSMTEHEGRLYAGTSNFVDGCEIWCGSSSVQSPTWYLAEGTNAWGFSTYITVENPNPELLTARLTYMASSPPESGEGAPFTRTVSLPPLSQTTISSEPDIGEVDFSTRVECLEGRTVAVDRTMFWTGEGLSPDQSGYHSSIGTTMPSKTWYLPEGSSAWGFETWTLVQNPSDAPADVTLTYMTEAGSLELGKTVPANSRATFNMDADIGTADAAIQVESDVPVVAERSMYKDERREGSCSTGTNEPSQDFFLAEGATGYDVDFTTYVLIQNPQDVDNDVALTYQMQSGAVQGPSFTMGPNSRKTVRVNDQLPSNTNVSTLVHGSRPLVAERAMYWDNGTGEAFHCSVGLSEPHLTFMLPDGQTGGGFETWTLVQNPNPGAVTVRITYFPQGGGDAVTFTDEISPYTRSTYNMADEFPAGRASILVESLDGARPVMVERAMYMNDRGAGTDTIGGFLY